MNQARQFVAKTRVLMPSEMNAVTQAAKHLEEARTIAERAEHDLAASEEAMREKGYAEGFEQGRAAALQDLGAAVAEARAHLMNLEAEMTEVLIVALENVLGHFDERDLARRCLMKGLQDAASELWAEIRVPTDDLERTRADLAQQPLDVSWPMIKSIESDPLLREGEMVIETPKGRIHVGLRHQLARFRAALTGAQT
jgi:flagellar biosynthesis/type III secretory pathway protein FliH